MSKYISSTECYGIFNDSFPPILDGVTLTVENYAKHLCQRGMTPVVVTPWNPERVEMDYPVMRFFSLPILSRAPYRYGYPKLDPFIWRRLKNTNFKLLHSHCPFSSGRLGVYAKKCKNIPLIGTFHSKYRDDLKHSFAHIPWMVDIIMNRILDFFNACDEVWIPQADVEKTVREYGYEGPLTVVENGNDYVDKLSGDIGNVKLKAKRECNIPENELSLLFVGQHIWEKGTDVILETLALLHKKVKFCMTFIGTGYAAEQMKKRVEESGLKNCVRFLGVISDRDELLKHYAAADIFLFPSLYDNAPLVVREAAAAFTPSIIPHGSTTAEVIRDGQNGFLCCRDAESYADKILYLYNNPAKIRTAAFGARESLVRSWSSVMDEVIWRYDDIISRNA